MLDDKLTLLNPTLRTGPGRSLWRAGKLGLERVGGKSEVVIKEVEFGIETFRK